MKTKNAIKKVNRLGLKIQRGKITPEQYYIIGKKDIISFWDKNGEVELIKIQSLNDKDDIQTDYSGGVWCKNLSQAIRMLDK